MSLGKSTRGGSKAMSLDDLHCLLVKSPNTDFEGCPGDDGVASPLSSVGPSDLWDSGFFDGKSKQLEAVCVTEIVLNSVARLRRNNELSKKYTN